MSEVFAMHYIPQRVRERGYDRYRLEFQDLQLAPSEEREITAYNELWLLLEAEEGITIRSDYGHYNVRDGQLPENVHEHADRILVRNASYVVQWVQFIQVVLQSKSP